MKALQSYRILDTAPIIKRLLREYVPQHLGKLTTKSMSLNSGGGFYVVAFGEQDCQI